MKNQKINEYQFNINKSQIALKKYVYIYIF